MRQRGNDDIAAVLFPGPDTAHAQTAPAGLVHLDQVFPGRDQLRLGGHIRALNKLAQFVHIRLGVIEQMNTGLDHLPQVMGRDIRGHPHRNAGGAIE